MKSKKSLELFTVVIAFTAIFISNTSAASGTDKLHNYSIGSREKNDSVFVQQNIFKESKFLRIVETENTFYAPKGHIITQINIFDQKSNGNGAYANITKGGVGHENVTIHFKSQRNHGIKFMVQIYAKPNNTAVNPGVKKSHDLIIGSRQVNDSQAVYQNIIKESSFLRKVEVEKTFQVAKGHVITQINLFDQKSNGNGAYAKVKKGGLNSENVTIEFESQRGHGINFVVQIFAKPNATNHVVVSNTTSNFGIGKSHSFSIGNRQMNDSQVIQQSITRPSEYLGIVEVKKMFSVPNNYIITQINVLDQTNNGTGGYPTIKEGGVNNKYVTIKFKSQQGQGINFVVQVFAKPTHL